jgi:hypothetical protein
MRVTAMRSKSPKVGRRRISGWWDREPRKPAEPERQPSILVSSLVEAYLPDLRLLLAAVPPLVLGAVGVALASGRLHTLAWLALVASALYVLGLLWRRRRLLQANAADFQTASQICADLKGSGRRPGAGDSGPGGAAGAPGGLDTLPDLTLLDLGSPITVQMGSGVDNWLNNLGGREMGVAHRAGPLGYGAVAGLFTTSVAGTPELVRVVAPPAWWLAGYVSGAASELGAPLVPGSHSYAAFVNESRALIAETRCATVEADRRLKEMLALPQEQRPLVEVTGAWIGPGVMLAGALALDDPTSDGLSIFPFALLAHIAAIAARHRPTFREVSFYGVEKSQLRVLARRGARRRA